MIYFDLLIFVALPQDTTVALLQVGRLPRNIQMVERTQLLLKVCARTHFRSGREDNGLNTCFRSGLYSFSSNNCRRCQSSNGLYIIIYKEVVTIFCEIKKSFLSAFHS